MNDETEKEETLSKQDFAARIRRSPSYVTALIRANRISLTDDGKRVRVADSLAMLAASKGPRDDVAARHEAARTGVQTPAPDTGAPVDPETRAAMRNLAQQRAIDEARKIRAQADREEMQRDKDAGNLVAADAADAAMKFLGATFRSLMDTFPDQVAALVGPVASIDECHALLTERCRDVTREFTKAIARQQEALKKDTAA